MRIDWTKSNIWTCLAEITMDIRGISVQCYLGICPHWNKPNLIIYALCLYMKRICLVYDPCLEYDWLSWVCMGQNESTQCTTIVYLSWDKVITAHEQLHLFFFFFFISAGCFCIYYIWWYICTARNLLLLCYYVLLYMDAVTTCRVRHTDRWT